MNAAAFLARGLAWGFAGLSLLKIIHRDGWQLALTALLWLAGLGAVAAITARGKPPLFNFFAAWGVMVALYLALALPW